MLDFLKTGGIAFMLVISVCGMVALYWAIKVGIKAFSQNSTENGKLIFVLFWGSIAAIIGVIAQMIGLMEAFAAIEVAGDISFGLMMGGLKVSMYSVVYGACIFVFSAIFWFVLRWKIENNKA